MMDPVEIGQRVRQARERKGWIQLQLAEAVGRRIDAISRLELGKTTRIPMDTLAKIADALDVTIEWLLGTPSPEPTYEPVHDDSRPMVDQLLDVYRFGLEKRAWVRERLPEIAFSVGATPSVVAPAIEMLARQYDAEEGGRISPPERERVEGDQSKRESIRGAVIGKGKARGR